MHDPQRHRNFLIVRKAKMCAAVVNNRGAEDEEGNDDELQHEVRFEEDGADVEEVVVWGRRVVGEVFDGNGVERFDAC